MHLIPCPWCGERHASEFTTLGERMTPRAEGAALADDAAWRDWLMFRDNTRGPLDELWWHVKGCGSWFALRRDTLTHAIAAPPAAGKPH
jgi:heterotetrameric sarcosine oxidase delta subunit